MVQVGFLSGTLFLFQIIGWTCCFRDWLLDCRVRRDGAVVVFAMGRVKTRVGLATRVFQRCLTDGGTLLLVRYERKTSKRMRLRGGPWFSLAVGSEASSIVGCACRGSWFLIPQVEALR